MDKFWEDKPGDYDGNLRQDDIDGIYKDLQLPFDSAPLAAVPRGTTEAKLAKKVIDHCYLRCKRMQEYFNSLKTACRPKPEQLEFLQE